MSHYAGCIQCGKALIYFEQEQPSTCESCHQNFSTHVTCEDGHFICDHCHSEKAYQYITDVCLESLVKNPYELATKVMKNPLIHMHGPEHHFLVSASLLSAYYQAGGGIDLKTCLKEALQRAKHVPGGICGLWGSCGAAIGTGIFMSILTKATPLSEKTWSLANEMTSLALLLISKHGGPRCCKRNTYLAIQSATQFVRKHFQISMSKPSQIQCGFFHLNDTCKKEACLFYPSSNRNTLA